MMGNGKFEGEIRGALFDLDGVLIDSEREYTRIWTEIDRAFPTAIPSFATRIKGMTLPEILSTYFRQEDHAAVTAMLDDREQAMHYEWLPGARELLAEFKALGVPCALVTSSNGVKMRHLREERPDLPGFFQAIVTADQVTHSKPHPEPYLRGAESIGCGPEVCVVFEDSLQGVKAGRAAGAQVVGLTTTLERAQIAGYCDVVIGDLSEFKWLKT